MTENLCALIPQWISAVATFIAALFTFKAASAAKKSADKQAELVSADIRPVLGLTNVSIDLFLKGYYPIHLYFTNHGKGAAWLYIVNASESGQPIEAHVGTPVCIGPGNTGDIKIFLKEKNKVYDINLSIFYWDIDGEAHSTKIEGYFEWMQPQVAINASWTVSKEEIIHNIPNLIKPAHVQHQSGPSS